MTSSWDFVQALSVLRSPARSHEKPTDINSTAPCWVGDAPVSMWSFDSISSALHADVGKWVKVKDEGDPKPPKKQTIPKQPKALPFVPSQLGIKDSRKEDKDESLSLVLPEIKKTTSTAGPHVTARDSTPEARRASLVLKLIKDFPEYAQRLERREHPRTNAKPADQHSIHVFVDISNILIGFHELVKENRGIPPNTRMRRIPFSFANFCLILERGRHSSKKVLVGSDRHASIYEAESLGYETNILERVQKNKPKFTYFGTSPSDLQENQDGDSSCNSASDNTRTRWVEQGVDEILHLKMLESLLDAERPATIVLATGDAAKAEYSDGFLSMVERALRRKWNVELVSFSHLTSWAYKKKEFRKKWGAQFKIIELDTYVEELLR